MRLSPDVRTDQAITACGRASHPRAVRLLLVVLVAAAAAGTISVLADADRAPDLSGALHSAAGSLAGLTWPVAICLLGVSTVHYLAATVAARTAAGIRLPFRELLTAQFVAATANRLTPAGLGGAGVLGRYLCRRGRLTAAQSSAAVTALALLGGVADVAAFACLLGLGILFRVPGASSELPLLITRLVRVFPAPHGMLLWVVVVAAAALLGTVCFVPKARTSAAAARATRAVSAYRRMLADLLCRPVRVLALMVAAAATTLSLSAGFAAAAIFGPTHLSATGFGALMIGYMVASAAANALPTPGGVGTADAALTGVLVAAGSAAAPSLATVFAFRAMTFWLPAIIGIPSAHRLRKRGAL